MAHQDLRILLTNDDGIDGPGLEALHRALSSVGTVTVVAPATGQSGIGRAISVGRGRGHDARGEDGLDIVAGRFRCGLPHTESDLGYAVEGTPCDCVVLGVHAFDWTPDVVVAGCNPGPNVGRDVLSRSGTTSAAMEAAYAGVPGVAASVDTIGYDRGLTDGTFDRTASLLADLVDRALDQGVFDAVDYLNVNGPRPDRPVESVEVTQPTPKYGMNADFEEGRFHLHFDHLERFGADDPADPPGTDLRAIAEGRVSVSPLSLPDEYRADERLDDVVNDLG